MRMPAWSLSAPVIVPIFVGLVLSACGQQDPSFQEETMTIPDDQADAIGAEEGGHGRPDPSIDFGKIDDDGNSESNDDDNMANGGDNQANGGNSGGNANANGGGNEANGGNGGGDANASGGGNEANGGNGEGNANGNGGDNEANGGNGGGNANVNGGGNEANGGNGGGNANGNGGGNEANGGNGGGNANGNGGGNGGMPGEEEVNLRQVTFDTTYTAKENVDILWIVDSSGSMSEEQTFLANSFGAFISTLVTADFDFQTAVTSTDVCATSLPANLQDRACPTGNNNNASHHRGKFIGASGKQVLAKSDYTGNLQALANVFKQNANVGTNGSGFEHGLTAAKMAVEKSLGGQNPALVRSESFLSIIVVSDEEDDGIGLSQTDQHTGVNYHETGTTSYKFTDDDFIGYMNTAVGAGGYSVSTITGTKKPNGTMCSANHSQPREEGTQYIKAAQKSGGLVLSICDLDWSGLLTKIGRDIRAQSTQIPLPEAPYDPGLIRVSVNGQPSTDWTYLSGVNAIKFEGSAVPPNNSEISITYYVEE